LWAEAEAEVHQAQQDVVVVELVVEGLLKYLLLRLQLPMHMQWVVAVRVALDHQQVVLEVHHLLVL
jgi:hypothetical protein